MWCIKDAIIYGDNMVEDYCLETKPKVLIIDDNYDNILLAMALLKKLDLQLSYSLSGAEGIELAKKDLPDVILLDVMMPEMDGIEVCRLIKNNPLTQDISIIFVSAKTEIDSVVSALGAGGVDYITKPFRQPELIARLKTHLQISLAQKTVKIQNQLLEKLNREKDQLMQITAHDLKNPLAGVLSVLEEISDINTINELQENIVNAKYGISSAMNIIYDLIDVYALENGKIRYNNEIFDINTVLKICLDSHKSRANFKHISLNISPYPEPIYVEIDKHKFSRVIDNLVSNAIKFSSNGSSVKISTHVQDDNVIITINDEGPGIIAEENSLLFKKFSTLSNQPTANENSTGLGLFIVKTLTNAMNGTIECQSRPGEGTTFILKFKLI